MFRIQPINIRRFAAMAVAGLLHAALVAELIRPVILPAVETPGENGSDERLIASVMLLHDGAVTRVDTVSFVPAMQPVEAITLPIPPLPLIEPTAADTFDSADVVENADDLEKAQRLEGIYVKNILDRLTRLMKAAPGQNDASIANRRCIVHVIQNDNGDVLDVDVNECDREIPARELLANTIRAASPLPPPPDGLAMGSYLTLDVSTL